MGMFKRKEKWHERVQRIANNVLNDSIGTKRAYKLSHLFFSENPKRWVVNEKRLFGKY